MSAPSRSARPILPLVLARPVDMSGIDGHATGVVMPVTKLGFAFEPSRSARPIWLWPRCHPVDVGTIGGDLPEDVSAGHATRVQRHDRRGSTRPIVPAEYCPRISGVSVTATPLVCGCRLWGAERSFASSPVERRSPDRSCRAPAVGPVEVRSAVVRQPTGASNPAMNAWLASVPSGSRPRRCCCFPSCPKNAGRCGSRPQPRAREGQLRMRTRGVVVELGEVTSGLPGGGAPAHVASRLNTFSSVSRNRSLSDGAPTSRMA